MVRVTFWLFSLGSPSCSELNTSSRISVIRMLQETSLYSVDQAGLSIVFITEYSIYMYLKASDGYYHCFPESVTDP